MKMVYLRKLFISQRKRKIIIPIVAGIGGISLLSGIYIGIMSWAEGFHAALDLFWSDRWIVTPIIAGFGVQTGLYAILKFRLFVPTAATGPSGKLIGTSGATSTVAMLACCAHHVTDLLPILGLATASAFLGRYRQTFLWVGMGMTLAGITIMLVILFRERNKVIQMASHSHPSMQTS